MDRVFAGYDPAVLDPDKPLESVARKLLCRPDNPNFQLLPEAVTKLVRDFQIDGVVAAVKRSCCITPSQMRRIKDEVYKATGVPTVILDADYGDSREYDDEATTAALDSFVETLLAKKGVTTAV
jgi:benzoyl-CoA reductase/2-hydroxyglutaryl-CoA dehydratase subunit BcrC/BadD/HgdB